MSLGLQKRLAIGAALVLLAGLAAANLHLVAIAFRSQPACVAVESAAPPARRAC